jgi:hypothetical protein
MLSDYGVTIFAAVMIAVATYGMTMMALQLMEWMLEVAAFLQAVSSTRSDNFAVNDATTFTPSSEMAGD